MTGRNWLRNESLMIFFVYELDKYLRAYKLSSAKRSKVDKINSIISHFYKTRNNHTSEDHSGGDENLSTSSSEE